MRLPETTQHTIVGLFCAFAGVRLPYCVTSVCLGAWPGRLNSDHLHWGTPALHSHAAQLYNDVECLLFDARLAGAVPAVAVLLTMVV